MKAVEKKSYLPYKTCFLKEKQEKRKSGITTQEFSKILSKIHEQKDTYVQRRRVIALLLLFLTGLRARNILLISKTGLTEFFKNGVVELDTDSLGWCEHLHWVEQRRVSISLTPSGFTLLTDYKDMFDSISFYKDDSSYVFSKEDEPGKHLSIDVFEKDLSMHLRSSSKALGKSFKLHELMPDEHLFTIHFC